MKHRLRFSTLRLPRRSVSNARLTTLDTEPFARRLGSIQQHDAQCVLLTD